MPLLKGNLHTHTTFSDGRLPADEVVARYRELGYDFLAITDHDDRIDDEYWFHIPPGDDRMLVLAGVEIDYRPLGQHVGKVTGDQETLFILNHPARYSLTVEQTLRRIRTITRDGLPIHAVEITDTGVYQAGVRRRRDPSSQGRHRRRAPGRGLRARLGRGRGGPESGRDPPRDQGGGVLGAVRRRPPAALR